MKNLRILILALLMVSSSACTLKPAAKPQLDAVYWKSKLDTKLPFLGHRNWILVVDKAFPEQSSPGMDYLNSGEDFHQVLKHVLLKLGESTHVKPVVYQDLELDFLSESLVPGSTAFSEQSAELLKSIPLQKIPHQDIFSKMDKASSLFNVLVIKTEATIPYSSIFIELDCKYWDDEKEVELRKIIESE